MTSIIFTSKTWTQSIKFKNNWQATRISKIREIVKLSKILLIQNADGEFRIREQNIFGLLSNLYHLRILQAFVEQEVLGFSKKEWQNLPRGKIHREGKCLLRLPKAEQLSYGPLLEDCLISRHQQSTRYETKLIIW